MKKIISIFILCFYVLNIQAQKRNNVNLDKLALQYAKASFDELYQFFSLPNDSHFLDDIEANVKWCETKRPSNWTPHNEPSSKYGTSREN